MAKSTRQAPSEDKGKVIKMQPAKEKSEASADQTQTEQESSETDTIQEVSTEQSEMQQALNSAIDQVGLRNAQSDKFVEMLLTSNSDRSYYIKDLLQLFNEDPEQFKATIFTTVPPVDAYYHRESPCPEFFRQRNHAFLNGITVELSPLLSDDMLWWQPVTDIKLLAATQELRNWTRDFSPVNNVCGFGGRKVEG